MHCEGRLFALFYHVKDLYFLPLIAYFPEEKKSQALFTRLYIRRLDIVYHGYDNIDYNDSRHGHGSIDHGLFYTLFCYWDCSGFFYLQTVLIPLMYLFLCYTLLSYSGMGVVYRKRDKSDI
jgi:hypothetical protein